MLNNQSEPIKVQIQKGHSVQVFKNKKYEFLMTTTEVANGYGVNNHNVRQTKARHLEELAEGYHFLRDEGVTKSHGLDSQSILWTKAGIVRLGFFIKSGNAKIFRDWAEKVILDKLDQTSETLQQAQQVIDFATNPQMTLDLHPTETIRVLPNELYEELMTIESKPKRMRLMKLYKGIMQRGLTV
jgi:prophage antirepressor-like protein